MSKPNQADIQIASVQPDELEELADLAASSFSDAFGSSMTAEDLEKSLRANRSVEYFTDALPTSHILVAKRAGKMVGYVQYGDVKIPEASAGVGDQELGRLYVDTASQGRGIGRRLMDEAMADPEMVAAPQIFLQVWDQNVKALSLYRSYGFVQVGVTHFTIGEDTPAEDLIMVRRPSTSGTIQP